MITRVFLTVLAAAMAVVNFAVPPAQAGRVGAEVEWGNIASTYKGKKIVDYKTKYAKGTVIVNTKERMLYLVLDNGKAMRYGVGVGRQGFSWSGKAKIAHKAKWPAWRPPAAMRKRQPELPTYMEGGINNPLGARALYLFEGGRDTLYRIHGTSQPHTIGLAVSSGCIRMLNDEVIDLYERVRIGARVVVI